MLDLAGNGLCGGMDEAIFGHFGCLGSDLFDSLAPVYAELFAVGGGAVFEALGKGVLLVEGVDFFLTWEGPDEVEVAAFNWCGGAGWGLEKADGYGVVEDSCCDPVANIALDVFLGGDEGGANEDLAAAEGGVGCFWL